MFSAYMTVIGGLTLFCFIFCIIMIICLSLFIGTCLFLEEKLSELIHKITRGVKHNRLSAKYKS